MVTGVIFGPKTRRKRSMGAEDEPGCSTIATSLQGFVGGTAWVWGWGDCEALS